MKLLKKSMEQKPEREDKQDTYFISSLIKVLQVPYLHVLWVTRS